MSDALLVNHDIQKQLWLSEGWPLIGVTEILSEFEKYTMCN